MLKDVWESEQVQEKKSVFLSKLKKGAISLVTIVGGILIVFTAIKLMGVGLRAEVSEAVENIVTDEEELDILTIESELASIGEFATSEYTYSDIAKYEDRRKLFDRYDIPLTEKSFTVAYNGIIKVGYPTKSIRVNVSNFKKEIYVTLPKAQILDNYIDTWEITERQNNCLNPIDGDEINQLLDDAKKVHLAKAEEKGLYDEAFGSADKEIKALLSGFSGYSVIVN